MSFLIPMALEAAAGAGEAAAAGAGEAAAAGATAGETAASGMSSGQLGRAASFDQGTQDKENKPNPKSLTVADVTGSVI